MRAALLLVVLLVGCATVPGEKRVIAWQEYSSQAELNRACDLHASTRMPRENSHGCYLQMHDGSFIIRSLSRAADRRTDASFHETLGHELEHVYKGDWHDSTGKRKATR